MAAIRSQLWRNRWLMVFCAFMLGVGSVVAFPDLSQAAYVHECDCDGDQCEENGPFWRWCCHPDAEECGCSLFTDC